MSMTPQAGRGRRGGRTLLQDSRGADHSRPPVRTVAEPRVAVDTFVAVYIEQWVSERNGFLSLAALREA